MTQFDMLLRRALMDANLRKKEPRSRTTPPAISGSGRGFWRTPGAGGGGGGPGPAGGNAWTGG